MDYKLTLEFSGNTASIAQHVVQSAERLEGVLSSLSSELNAIADLCDHFQKLKKQPVPVPPEEK